MNYFFDVKERSPTLCVHPLLLSLTAALNASTDSPNISSISENDPRVLSHKYYTSLSDLPPLEIHIAGQNGMLHSNSRGFPLKSAASCGKCMPSELPQVLGEEDVAIDMSGTMTLDWISRQFGRGRIFRNPFAKQEKEA